MYNMYKLRRILHMGFDSNDTRPSSSDKMMQMTCKVTDQDSEDGVQCDRTRIRHIRQNNEYRDVSQICVYL